MAMTLLSSMFQSICHFGVVHCRFLDCAQAFMWQLNFSAAPPALKDLEHLLKVDERVIRYVILRRSVFTPFPSTHSVAKRAKHLLEKRKTD
jgi:hypothetical protein